MKYVVNCETCFLRSTFTSYEGADNAAEVHELAYPDHRVAVGEEPKEPDEPDEGDTALA